MRSVADSLNSLRQWRNLCDYDDVVPNLQGVVAKSLNEAESVIRQL